jgi:uncharacterized small protein (DUF1192 family)
MIMARDADDDVARPAPGPALAARDLGPMSIDELNAYIAALEQEIARVRDNIAAKQRHRSGAESLFRR